MPMLELIHRNSGHCHTYRQAEWAKENPATRMRDGFRIMRLGEKILLRRDADELAPDTSS